MSTIPGISAAMKGPDNCCSTAVTQVTVPLSIANAPGLPAIHYRIGTFTSFRRAMLDMVALPDLLSSAQTTLDSDNSTTITVQGSAGFPLVPPFQIKVKDETMLVTDGAGTNTWKVQRGSATTVHAKGEPVILDPPNPFALWHEGIDNDYQTIFVELWAYLADILTFYQERIANEAFLGTATLRDSLLRLVTTIDYRPSPGAGASGIVAFTAAKNQSAVVPKGFRVGSRPKPGAAGVVFETMAAVAASGDNSLIPFSTVSPDVPFSPGTIVLQGINNRLNVNDYLLSVELQGQEQVAFLLQITSLTLDQKSGTTVVTWLSLGDDSYTSTSKQALVYVFRIATVPFGASAPPWITISPVLTTVSSTASPPRLTVPFPENWDDPTKPSFYVPAPDDQGNVLYLDGVYSQLKYTAANPGFAVLLTDGIAGEIFAVTDSRPAAKAAYSISAKVTRLTFDNAITATTFPVRQTVVLTGSELLTLQNNVALSEVLPDPVAPDPTSAKTVVLSGIHTGLSVGQTVVIKGNLFDPLLGAPTSIVAVETAVIDASPVADATNNVTRVRLRDTLSNRYERSTCVLLGNVAEVTQGETVKDEVLGSADGGAFQAYPLKKSPLTYLPSTDPEGLSATQSTLLVTVNDVAWNEQPNLVGSAPDDQDFTTTFDDTGQTTVVFGDGFHGACPPKGVNNIHARYRKGVGSAGNVVTGSIQQLIDSVPNLQKVTNPMPANGGADPETLDKIRLQAPASLQTFGRAVSAADYGALARIFPGIAKASAAWIVQDPVTLQAVSHPYVQLTLATSNQVPIAGTPLAAKLRRFLDNHRDPNVRLRIKDSASVFITVAVTVDIDARSPHQATLDRVMAALTPNVNPDGSAGYFAFQNLQFGESIFLSAVYAAVQAVPGVADATITALRRVGPGNPEDPALAPHDITVRSTEIITIVNDPQNPATGLLSVTGQGGFVDT